MTMVGAGTPAYMAPEQVLGKTPSPQTDIYSLGIVLFEMLTGGERPFTGEQARIDGSTSEKVRWEHTKLKPPSPLAYNPAISRELEKVVLKCLEKEPAQRYASALELLQAIGSALGSAEETQDFVTETTQIEHPAEKAERESAEKAVQEKAKKEFSEKFKREKAERQAGRKAALAKAHSKSFTALKSVLTQAIPFLRIVGIIGIIIVLFWGGSLAMPTLLSLVPTVKPSPTVTFTPSPIPPTKTQIPTPTKTKAPTSTPIGGGHGQIIFLSGSYEKDQWNVFSISDCTAKTSNSHHGDAACPGGLGQGVTESLW
jgi:serine/threonine-protein kinase